MAPDTRKRGDSLKQVANHNCSNLLLYLFYLLGVNFQVVMFFSLFCQLESL